MARRAATHPRVLLALALIVLAGAGLRGWEAAHPRVAAESADERFYAALARTLAEDGHYGDRSSGPFHPFHAAPGAPFAFALAYRVTPPPRESPTDIASAYWLLALVGTLLIVATFALGRRLGGDAAGLAAAAVVAAYPPLVRTTGELLSEPLGALALTLAVPALVGGRRRELALGGALLGLAALARPDLLVLVLVCPVVLVALRKQSAVNAGIVLAAGVLVIAPWVLFASSRAGYLVPIVESDAPTLMVGAYLPGDGTTQGFKRAYADETRARLPQLRGLSDLELPGTAVIDTVRGRRPQLGRREALRAEALANVRRYALGRPVAFAAMMARKAGRMWGRPSGDRSAPAGAFHRLVLGLSLAGLAAGLLRRRRADLLLIASIMLASTLLHAVLVSHPRYALPLIPVVVAAGASGLSGAVSSRSRRCRPRAPRRLCDAG